MLHASASTRIAFVLALVVFTAAQQARAATAASPDPSRQAPTVKFNLGAAVLCNHGAWFPDGNWPRLDDSGCVVQLRSGATFFWLYFDRSRTLFQEARVRSSFLAPAAPPAGATAYGLQLLHHLLVVYVFDPDGVGIVPIGDFTGFLCCSVPPYLAGDIIAKVNYGDPFEVNVGMTIQAHRITVRQGNRTLAIKNIEKPEPHPESMEFTNLFLSSTPMPVFNVLSFRSAEFQGVESLDDGEYVVGGGPALGSLRIERLGDEIRVFAPPE